MLRQEDIKPAYARGEIIMFRNHKMAVATVALMGMGCLMGTARPAQACELCEYERAQSRSGVYYYMGQPYRSWPAARRRIIGSVAPGSTYSVGKGKNRRYYQNRNLHTLWGYNTRSEYQNNLNMALTFGGR
jgi:hypothetical protein